MDGWMDDVEEGRVDLQITSRLCTFFSFFGIWKHS